MDDDFISDNRLKTFWQKWLNNHREYYLPNLRLCGTRITQSQGAVPAVFVLRNKKTEQSRLYGTANCHSAWACPKCTAEVMAKQAAKIAAGIDCLKKHHQQTAIMITFTIPHTKNMSCKDTFQILRDTWRLFVRNGNRSGREKSYILKNNKGERGKKGGALGVGEKGTKKIYKVGQDPFGTFREELQIKHMVRVFEFTWGENSWHPHIHALFWIPNKNFDKILDYEIKLINRWWDCLKKRAKEFWSKKITNKEELNHFMNTVYADNKRITSDGHKALYISRDSKNPNKARKVSSSWYIAGWGGDKEVTGNYKQKATHGEGHMTPFQIITKAFESQGEEREKHLRLYAEYAQTTYKHRRCNFSPTGLTKLIAEYLQTEEYKVAHKKKDTDKAKNWEIVYWFGKSQWREILLVQMIKGIYLIDDILELARAPNARELIKMHLEKYNIDTRLETLNYNTEIITDLVNGTGDKDKVYAA